MDKKLYNRLRTIRNSIDNLMDDMKCGEFDLEPYYESDTHRDFDVIAVGKSKSQQERIKSILDIIRELEREDGSAALGLIITRAGILGFDKDKVESELTKLVQEAAIFEPVHYSGNYRLTQQ